MNKQTLKTKIATIFLAAILVFVTTIMIFHDDTNCKAVETT